MQQYLLRLSYNTLDKFGKSLYHKSLTDEYSIKRIRDNFKDHQNLIFKNSMKQKPLYPYKKTTLKKRLEDIPGNSSHPKGINFESLTERNIEIKHHKQLYLNSKLSNLPLKNSKLLNLNSKIDKIEKVAEESKLKFIKLILQLQ